MMSDQQSEQQQQPIFQYSVKVERTSKGARWTMHCYSDDREIAIREAVEMYEQVGERLEDRGLGVAPVEKGGGKNGD